MADEEVSLCAGCTAFRISDVDFPAFRTSSLLTGAGRTLLYNRMWVFLDSELKNGRLRPKVKALLP